MAKQSNQKAKLLYLQKFLMEETDAAHGITIAELVEKLAAVGIAAERKSLYDDIEVLRSFGLDIATERGRANSYKLVNRCLMPQEVAAACQALQQTGAAGADELTAKLCSLLSRYDAELVKEELAAAKEHSAAEPEALEEPAAAEEAQPEAAESAEADAQADEGQTAAEAEIAAAVLEEEEAIEAEAEAMRKAVSEEKSPQGAAEAAAPTEEIEIKCAAALQDEVLAYLGSTARVVKTKSSGVVIKAQAACTEDFYVQLIKWGSGVKLSEPSYRRKEFVKYFKKILSNYK